ncbi:putative ankyrin repeat protein [Powai lake megavirus]|uniref:Putative ankyrin repeat protein n=1 Tax=Powai lake megavirus TaxID=1842663 RepID=A0A167R3H2_9VIRU|nr:putative ankyrin repeat protein [Powai lake megavirus]ANB50272.1 putative ankyrin repeat protein [Powai lake megavirus]
MSDNINQENNQIADIIDIIDFVPDNIEPDKISDEKIAVDFINDIGPAFNDIFSDFNIVINNKTYDNIVNTAYDIRQLYDPKMTSLMVACHISNHDDCLDIVKQLLKVGMQVNLTNSQGLTALDMATKNNNTKIIKCLLDYGATMNTNIE